MRSPRQCAKEFTRNPFWIEKVLQALGAAWLVAAALRVWMLPALAMVYPIDAPAAELVQRALGLTAIDFWLSAAAASGGGITSYFKDLKESGYQFVPTHMLGHMFSAQFAGLMGFLLSVQYQLAMPLGLVAAGMFGWLGNVALDALGQLITRTIRGFKGV